LLYEPVSARERGRGCPRGKPQLAKDVRDVAVDGVLAENEALRDVVIRETLGNETEYLELARAQLGERRVRTRPARDSTCRC
jgi:hypothetical protein